MSGRAGRRGLDDRGTVIVMIDKETDPTISDTLYKGEADPLTSAFHLSYNMVLNLLRVEEINPEYMLEKSFYQFQHYSDLPKKYESMILFTFVSSNYHRCIREILMVLIFKFF